MSSQWSSAFPYLAAFPYLDAFPYFFPTVRYKDPVETFSEVWTRERQLFPMMSKLLASTMSVRFALHK